MGGTSCPSAACVGTSSAPNHARPRCARSTRSAHTSPLLNLTDSECVAWRWGGGRNTSIQNHQNLFIINNLVARWTGLEPATSDVTGEKVHRSTVSRDSSETSSDTVRQVPTLKDAFRRAEMTRVVHSPDLRR